MLLQPKSQEDGLIPLFNHFFSRKFSVKIITDFRYNAQKYYIKKAQQKSQKPLGRIITYGKVSGNNNSKQVH